MTTMRKLGVSKPLANVCKALGIKTPTPVQVACIPHILKGENVIGAAPTGSGKTASFALPILQKLAKDPFGIFALVLTPTRELAIQIKEQFCAFGEPIGVRCVTIIGGVDSVQQALELAKTPHIVICTPGRLVAHLETNRNDLHLKRLKFLVFDEADRLLSPNFANDIGTILDSCPPAARRQTLYFSATMTTALDRLTQISDKPAFRFDHSPDQPLTVVRDVKQCYAFMPERVKICYLVYALRNMIENDTHAQAIVFARTCRRAEQLCMALNAVGVVASSLHARRTQAQRSEALGALRAGHVSAMCATDVAARGLDIPALALVVHYDAALAPDDYVHRTGRTARAGRSGVALSLVCEADVDRVRAIEAATGTELSRWQEDEDDVLRHLKDSLSAWRVAGVKLEHSGFDEQTKKRADRRKLEKSLLAAESTSSTSTIVKSSSSSSSSKTSKKRKFNSDHVNNRKRK